jgi:hypothetical protein
MVASEQTDMKKERQSKAKAPSPNSEMVCPDQNQAKRRDCNACVKRSSCRTLCMLTQLPLIKNPIELSSLVKQVALAPDEAITRFVITTLFA